MMHLSQIIPDCFVIQYCMHLSESKGRCVYLRRHMGDKEKGRRWGREEEKGRKEGQRKKVRKEEERKGGREEEEKKARVG